MGRPLFNLNIFYVPTFFIMVLFFCLFQSVVLFAGHATFYDYKIDLFKPNSTVLLSHKVGVQHVFSDLSFRLFSIGGYRTYDNFRHGILNVGYGRYWDIHNNYKFMGMVLFESGYDFSSSFSFKSILKLGFMRRLSSRLSSQLLLGTPFLSVNQKSSFIVTLGLNYFYGSGIAYRESSDMLKNVKKKFLWFLWFND